MALVSEAELLLYHLSRGVLEAAAGVEVLEFLMAVVIPAEQDVIESRTSKRPCSRLTARSPTMNVYCCSCGRKNFAIAAQWCLRPVVDIVMPAEPGWTAGQLVEGPSGILAPSRTGAAPERS